MTPREFKTYAESRQKQFEDENYLADRRSALIAMILANRNRDKKKKHKPFTIEDFMPKKKKQIDNKPMKPEVMAEVLKAIAVASLS